MMKFAGQKVNIDTLLLALTVDKLAMLYWTKTKDAEKGRNRPASLFEVLSGKEKEPEADLETFESIEEFEARRKEIIKEVNNG